MKPELTILARLAGQCVLKLPTSTLPVLESQAQLAMPSLYRVVGNLNSGPFAFIASVFIH